MSGLGTNCATIGHQPLFGRWRGELNFPMILRLHRNYCQSRLANHGFGRDITDRYIVFDVEQLREPMQRIADEFLYI
jgi:hypothetical protein